MDNDDIMQYYSFNNRNVDLPKDSLTYKSNKVRDNEGDSQNKLDLMRIHKISLFKDNIYQNITKQENGIYKQPNITSKKLELNQNRTSIANIEIDNVDVNKTYLTFYSNDNLYF